MICQGLLSTIPSSILNKKVSEKFVGHNFLCPNYFDFIINTYVTFKKTEEVPSEEITQ